MNKIIFKQRKPLKPKVFGIVLLGLVFYIAFFHSEFSVKSLILLIISFCILSYSYTYVIEEGFKNYKYLSVFGIKLPNENLKLDFPDYISVFPISLKQKNDWSTVSALGTSVKHDEIAIKVFSKHNNFTLFITRDYQEAINKAKLLSEMLNIRLVDKTINSST